MKFYKAKNVQDNEWVEGYYLFVSEQNKHYILTGKTKLYQVDLNHPHIQSPGFEWIEVHGETVSSDTGLVDINNVKIYANDLYVPLYITPTNETSGFNEDLKGYVEYNHGEFIVKPKYDRDYSLSNQIKKDFVEYRSNVGEIYDYVNNICLGKVIGNKFN